MKVFILEDSKITEEELKAHWPYLDQIDKERILALAVGETCPVMEMQTIIRVK